MFDLGLLIARRRMGWGAAWHLRLDDGDGWSSAFGLLTEMWCWLN